jgi:hypothetical protein
MKHLKMLGLFVMAAASLMAFSSSASATILTSPSGTKYEGKIEATAVSSLLLQASFANITCTQSTVAGTPTNFGSATETVSGPISTLSFSSCNATVTVLNNGRLEIHTEKAKENGNGTLTGSGSKVTVAVFGTSCVYGTGSGTDLGTLKGSDTGTAKMEINANLPLEEGGFGCANPATWTGSYSVTNPDNLTVD